MWFIYDRDVSNRFPRIGVIGAGHLARMMVAPATALGVDLLLFAKEHSDSGAQITQHVVGDYTNLSQVLEFAKSCDLVTFEHELVPLSVIKGLEAEGIQVYPTSTTYSSIEDKSSLDKVFSQYTNENLASASGISSDLDSEISVMVARSPHGQATSWAPTQKAGRAANRLISITPAPSISSGVAEQLQKIALEIAQAINLVGVISVEMLVSGDGFFLKNIEIGPSDAGLWSIEGSVTSQFEQHLRAILDLPLGNPAMSYQLAVTGIVLGGEKTDMYRPYLHLMARNPSMHFHQYKNAVQSGEKVSHLTACGDDLEFLIEEVEHACEYMSGVIDE